MTYLLRLKGDIQVLNGNYSFRTFGLLDQKTDGDFREGAMDRTNVLNCTPIQLQSEGLVIYLFIYLFGMDIAH